MACDGFGDRVVIGRRSEGLTPTRVRELARGGAQLVRNAGADSIVYLAVNGPAFPIALFAAARAGVPLVPVNYRMGAEQLDLLLANHASAFGIAGSTKDAETLLRAGLSPVTPDEFVGAAATAADGDDSFVEPDTAAVIIYTS